MSAKSIFSNKARSALTMLGIIIGLAAVIVLVSYAQGQNMAMQRYYESMGTNKISVSAYDWTGGTDISQSLYDYCLNLSDQVVGFSPTGTVNSAPPIKFGSKTLAQDTNGGGAIIMGGGMAVSGDRGSNYPTLYLGNNQFGQCNDYTIAKGRDLSYLDVKNSSKVCVLGAATADYLFNFANPIDQIITISGTPFRVVGVYSYKGDRSSSASGTEDDQWINQMISGMDKMILLPSTMNRIFNENEPISDYVVKVRSSEDLRPVITGLKGFLSGVIDSNNGFYSVDSNDVYKEQQGDATKMHRRHLPPRRRHRYYEHHAGHRHRAHPGDRHPQGHRRRAPEHHRPVPHRSRHDLRHRRPVRHRGGLYRHPDRGQAVLQHHPDPQPGRDPGGGRHLGGPGHHLRYVSRHQGLRTSAGGSPAGGLNVRERHL